MKNILTLGAITLGMVLVSGSAFAAEVPISVPEPMSMSLLAGGIIAIAAVKRMRRS